MNVYKLNKKCNSYNIPYRLLMVINLLRQESFLKLGWRLHRNISLDSIPQESTTCLLIVYKTQVSPKQFEVENYLKKRGE